MLSVALRYGDLWVPGHGDVVDRAFVLEQADVLAELAARCTEVVSHGGVGVEAFVTACRGIGLETHTLREAAVRVLELRH